MSWYDMAVGAWASLVAVGAVIILGGAALDAMGRGQARRRGEALAHIASIMVATDSSRGPIASDLMALPRPVLLDVLRHLSRVIDGDPADVLRGVAQAVGVEELAYQRAHARGWRRRVQAADLLSLTAQGEHCRSTELQRMLLADPDARVIARTAQGIDVAGVYPLRHELGDLLSHNDHSVAIAAAAALTRAPQGLEPVLQTVAARSVRDATLALQIAAASGDAELAAWAIGFHDDPNPEIRRWALRSAPHQPSFGTAEIVRWRCSDSDPHVRCEAVWAASELGDPSLLIAMGALLDDDDHDVRAAAGEALAQLGPLGRIMLRGARSEAGPNAQGIIAQYLQPNLQPSEWAH